ncbi:hypothetical protein HNY73_013990 [Argiope bruennichi]|uniref:Uncharacterized protein n=1 Tax=Argiope bruennichi TaxID=94029 RepID=A0A8T0ERS3_ARGBR|nr:hypothetical protein HNY73_013990 [Argiope bruennichi]
MTWSKGRSILKNSDTEYWRCGVIKAVPQVPNVHRRMKPTAGIRGMGGKKTRKPSPKRMVVERRTRGVRCTEQTKASKNTPHPGKTPPRRPVGLTVDAKERGTPAKGRRTQGTRCLITTKTQSHKPRQTGRYVKKQKGNNGGDGGKGDSGLKASPRGYGTMVKDGNTR